MRRGRKALGGKTAQDREAKATARSGKAILSCFEWLLGVGGNIAAVLTGIVAVWAYGFYQWERCSRRKALENHLKAEKEKAKDRGQRAVLHLVAHLNMSQDNVLDAAFNSKKVKCVSASDNKDRVALILFEYTDG